MAKNQKLIKLLTAIGLALLFAGLTLLIYLEIKLLNLPVGELASFSETFRFPSSMIKYLSPKTPAVQNLPTLAPDKSATIAAVSPYHGKFTGVLADDIKLVFPNPNYQEINNLIEDATKQTDLNLAYADCKKAFNLMKTAYLSSRNSDMQTAMAEFKLATSILPQFSDADMEMPK